MRGYACATTREAADLAFRPPLPSASTEIIRSGSSPAASGSVPEPTLAMAVSGGRRSRPADVLRHATERRDTRGCRPTLPNAQALHSQCRGQRVPGLRFGSRDGRHELHGRGALTAEVREIDPQRAEEAGPTEFGAFKLVVPVVGAGEEAVHHTDETHTTGARFDVTATGLPSRSSNSVAMRAAAGRGFIVILRHEFRDGFGEFVAERRPVRRRPEANLGIHCQGRQAFARLVRATHESAHLADDPCAQGDEVARRQPIDLPIGIDGDRAQGARRHDVGRSRRHEQALCQPAHT